MKRTIIYLPALFALVQLAACSKNYLERTDPTRVNADLFYKDAKQIEQAVNGVYSGLQGIVGTQYLFNELTSDNATIDFNPGDRGSAPSNETFEFYNYNSGTGNINAMYVSVYAVIANANNSLAKMKDVADLSDSIRAVNEGQLKFVRAYLYYQLVQYFGSTILIVDPIPADNVSKSFEYVRETPEIVYAQIEKDLTEAVAALPANYPNSRSGRASKAAALTLLGRVYLTKKQYAEAQATLSQVLSLGYSLNPSYADNYDIDKENGPESIFAVQFKGDDDLGEWSSFAYTFLPRLSTGPLLGYPQVNSGGWNIPTKDLIASYEAGDLRKEATIGMNFVSPVTKDTIPYVKKYMGAHTIAGRTNDNWPVFRYADVLLMLAEAINEVSGPTTEAYDYVNQVRARAGLAPLSGLDQAGFRTAVWHERRVELAFENWRWFDLKRMMTPAELTAFITAYVEREKANPTVKRQGIPYANNDYIFSEHEVLFPIPNNERIVNSNLTQNPGY